MCVCVCVGIIDTQKTWNTFSIYARCKAAAGFHIFMNGGKRKQPEKEEEAEEVATAARRRSSRKAAYLVNANRINTFNNTDTSISCMYACEHIQEYYKSHGDCSC